MTRARDVANIDGLLTAKGDIYAATAAGTPARLGVGTNGQALLANSGTATGLEWATPAAGGMTLLSTTTLSGTSTTISSISQSHTNLLIVGSAITLSGADRIRINPNSNASITDQILNNASTTIDNSNSNCLFPMGNVATQASGSSDFATNIILYSSSTVKKPFNSFGVNAALPVSGFSMGRINTNTAISSIQITTNGGTSTMGGTITIYGVK